MQNTLGETNINGKYDKGKGNNERNTQDIPLNNQVVIKILLSREEQNILRNTSVKNICPCLQTGQFTLYHLQSNHDVNTGLSRARLGLYNHVQTDLSVWDSRQLNGTGFYKSGLTQAL